MSTLIVDVDTLLYKAGFAVEKTLRKLFIDKQEVGVFDKHKDVLEAVKQAGIDVNFNLVAANTEDQSRILIKKKHEVGPEKKAVQIADQLMTTLLDQFPDWNHVLYMRGKSKWRYDIWPLYKHKRETAPKPVHLKSIVRHYERKFNVRIPSNMEADDACSVKAYECLKAGEQYIVMSVDKDLLQIPGTHFNYTEFFEGRDPIINVTPWQGEVSLWQQILSGDSTDDIPGCPGYGKGKAKNLLQDAQDQEELITTVYSKYVEVYGEQDALEVMNMNASLVYLLRNPDEYWSLEL